jgi:hypothetical protein
MYDLTLRSKFTLMTGLIASVLAWSGSAQAIECTVGATTPGAELTHATECGVGDSGSNPSRPLEADNLTWQWIEKNDTGEGPNPFTTGVLLTSPNGVTEGLWGINTNLTGYTDFLLVLKDGNIHGYDAQWVWFNIDESLTTCTTGAMFDLGATLCGSWKMYSNQNGERQAVSHYELYGRGATTVPLPGTLALLGLGALAIGAATRRRAAAAG